MGAGKSKTLRVTGSCLKTVWRLAVFAAVFFMGAFSTVVPTVAGDVTPLWKTLVSRYLDLAFHDSNSALRKFDNAIGLPIGVDCKFIGEDECLAMKYALKQSFTPNNNVYFSVSSTPKLLFVFTDNSHISDLSVMAQSAFKDGYKEFSDTECEVFSSADSDIKSAQVLVSSNQDSKKLRVCLVMQIAVSMGLQDRRSETFASAWAGDSGNLSLSNASSDDINNLQQSVSIMEFIHSCSEIAPGMHREQVENLLLQSESCISKLGGIKDGG